MMIVSLTLLLFLSAASGTAPHLLADLNPGLPSSGPFAMVNPSIGTRTYFSATTAATGIELFSLSSFGLDDVRLEADLYPGPTDGYPWRTLLFGADGHRFFFTAKAPDTGREIYRVNVAQEDNAHTPELLQDVWPGAASSSPNSYLVVGDKLFLTATTEELGDELYVLDSPTSSEVRLVAEVCPGTCSGWPRFLVASGDASYVLMQGRNETGDPTSPKMQWGVYAFDVRDEVLRAVVPPPEDGSFVDIGVMEPVPDSNVMFFVYNSQHLYRTDGVDATMLVSTSSPMSLAVYNGRAYYCTHAAEPGGGFLFRVQDGVATALHGTELWTTCRDLHTVGDFLYVIAETAEYGRELWRMDTSETVLVLDSCPGSCPGVDPESDPSVESLATLLGDSVWFSLRDEDHGVEVWRAPADGTAPPMLFHDVNPGPNSSHPYNFVQVPTREGGTPHVLCVADDGEHGAEFWVLITSDVDSRDPGSSDSDSSYKAAEIISIVIACLVGLIIVAYLIRLRARNRTPAWRRSERVSTMYSSEDEHLVSLQTAYRPLHA